MREGPWSVNLTPTVYSNNHGKQRRNLLSGAEKQNVLQHHDASSMYYLVEQIWKKTTYVSTCTGYVAFLNCLKQKIVNSDPFEALRSGSTIKRLCDMIVTIMRSPEISSSKHQVIWSILNDLPTVIFRFKLITSLSKERLFHAYMINLLKIPPWKLQQVSYFTQKKDFTAQIRNMLPMSRCFQYTNTSF